MSTRRSGAYGSRGLAVLGLVSELPDDELPARELAEPLVLCVDVASVLG